MKNYNLAEPTIAKLRKPVECLEDLTDTYKEYSESTSVHGLKYIVEDGRPLFER